MVSERVTDSVSRGVWSSTDPQKMNKWKFSYHKMHQFCIFHGGLCAAVNTLWPGPPKGLLNWCHCELHKQWRIV